MAFIDKKDPVVLNIKLTSKGRELLSEGNLNFAYYAIGDSEIDYKFNNETNHNPFNSLILRPADKNPSILSFITKNLSGDTFNTISNVPSTPTIIQNTAPSLGFFNISSGNTSFITDSDHLKQPDAMVKIDNVSGGTLLELYQAPTYLANVNEPSIGDFILIKWTNPMSVSTTGNTINITNPTPYLIYKIQGILNGTLAANNLIVQVDRELPNFSQITGGTNGKTAGALIYYNYINFTGNTIFSQYSTDYVNESILTFLQNCQCPTITFPFWNMSIVYTDEIVGVQNTYKKFGSFNSKLYGGFVSYIQNQAPKYKKLGVIHYSNSSPSNTYGEELYQNTPTLDIPTIMWHKSPTKTLGAKFKAYGSIKLLTGATKSLNTAYYDLADTQGNVVGKVFTELKLFVIEDQELLFAMSYKSNRSWTLPNYIVGINDNVSRGCPTCTIDFSATTTSPSIINGNDGSIYISNIINNIPNSKLILSVSGQTSGQIFFAPITGNTLISNLGVDTYFVIIHDLSALNCEGKLVNLTNPTSSLFLYDVNATASGLFDDFLILNYFNGYTVPTKIAIHQSFVGTIYGNGSVLVKEFGSPILISDTWTPLTNGSIVEFDNLTFKSAYTVYVRDYINPTTEFISHSNYVAAGSPLKLPFIVSPVMTDSGGTYILIGDYLASIDPANNPIVGVIEFGVLYNPTNGAYDKSIEWKQLPVGSEIGYTMKYYGDFVNHPYFSVHIRERYDSITMYVIQNNN